MRGGLSRCALLVVLPAAAAACTHRPLTVSAPVADGGEVDAAIDAAPADARDGGDATAPRVPRKHRAAGQACPHERGPSTLTADQLAQCTSSPSLSQLVDCRGDADCTAGTNGECVLRPAPFACLIDCSYDQCFDDSGCASPAPCSCRASGTSPDANHCLTGSECRVDADCGPGGFCSPSLPDQILCV